MRTLLFTVLLGSCAAMSAASEPSPEAAPPLGITLKAEAISAGEQVVLKDVATLSDVSDEKRIVLEAIAIGRAAQPGQNRAFMQVDVVAALRKAGYIAPVNPQGAPSVTVTAALERISGKQFADTASAAVRAYFEKDSDLDAEVEITSVPTDLVLRPGEFTLEAELPESGARPGAQSVRVRVMQDDRRIADPVVGVKVKLTGPVQVAAEKMLAGDLLSDTNIKILRKEMNANDFLNRTNAAKLIGMRAKKSINADEALNKTSFAMPQVIKRGDAVTVYVKRGGLELTTRGEAKGDAALDEAVRVIVADSNAEVIARASGSREVTLDDPISRKRN